MDELSYQDWKSVLSTDNIQKYIDNIIHTSKQKTLNQKKEQWDEFFCYIDDQITEGKRDYLEVQQVRTVYSIIKNLKGYPLNVEDKKLQEEDYIECVKLVVKKFADWKNNNRQNFVVSYILMYILCKKILFL